MRPTARRSRSGRGGVRSAGARRRLSRARARSASSTGSPSTRPVITPGRGGCSSPASRRSSGRAATRFAPAVRRALDRRTRRPACGVRVGDGRRALRRRRRRGSRPRATTGDPGRVGTWSGTGRGPRRGPRAWSPCTRGDDDRLGARPATYDVVVIGAGAGGGVAACVLAESGARVLLVERGEWLPFHEVGRRSRSQPPSRGVRRQHAGGDHRRTACARGARPASTSCGGSHEPGWNSNAMTVGGGTRVYGAQGWRFFPDDFRMATRVRRYPTGARSPTGRSPTTTWRRSTSRPSGRSGWRATVAAHPTRGARDA